MLIVFSVAIGVFVAGDSAGSIIFSSGICVLHVGVHLDDVHATVSIKHTAYRFGDVRLREDRF